MNSKLYIGVMSGTSVDAIDAVLLETRDDKISSRCFESLSFPADLRKELLALCIPGDNEIDRMGKCDTWLAEIISTTVNALIKKSRVSREQIHAIGSHGQTIRHQPTALRPFSLQIGNPSLIAQQTQITTIADFRMADIAAGGQGAPLVPAFHHAAFSSHKEARAIINIGGISNISILRPNNKVSGYDIGPGNTLMDQWIQKHQALEYDRDGSWARQGKVNEALLSKLLSDPFLSQRPPKSTGREHYNLKWLMAHENDKTKDKTENWQRTLLEYTARTISDAIMASDIEQIYLCGGGVSNGFLMERLRELTPLHDLNTTDALGIHPQHVEASAFAWLAQQTLEHQPGNCVDVTGASHAKILGGIYYP